MTSPQAPRTIQDVELLIHAKWLVPMEGPQQLLADHCIVVDQGKIVDVLSSVNATSHYHAKETHELGDHIVLPGLINAHGHSAMSLFRGLADDLPLMEWLNDHIWPAEGQWVNPAFVEDGTRLAIAEMIKGGTTCFSDMYFFPEVAAKVAEEIGMRAQFVCPVLDFPTAWGSGPEEYLEKSMALAIDYAESDLIRVGLGPHAPYTVSDTPLENVRDLAREYDIPVQIHLHETQHEVDEAIKISGSRPIARLQKLGLIGDDIPLQCVHMTALNDEDIEILKASKASVVHCPESNLKLASGFCPIKRLQDAQINICLGTDGAASNNDLDLVGEMRTAALLAKAVAGDASALKAYEALEMATINGAKALGIDAQCGSLSVGKAADIIAVDLNRLNSQPSYDPISDLVYAVSANQVSHVWIAGKAQLAEGKLIHLDERKLIENAQQWATKINSQSANEQE